jgi:hypothetical protein
MNEQSRTKLIPQKTEAQNQTLQANQGINHSEHELALNELDREIGCPRCNGIMEPNSSFDVLVYFCENCSFILKSN